MASALITNTTQTWDNLLLEIELSKALSDRAKAALERLSIQSWWHHHPASFYHSAAQELIALFESGYMQIVRLRSSELDGELRCDVSMRKFDWKVGERVLVHFERPASVKKGEEKTITRQMNQISYNNWVLDSEIICITSADFPVSFLPDGKEGEHKDLKCLEKVITSLMEALQGKCSPETPPQRFAQRSSVAVKTAGENAEKAFNTYRPGSNVQIEIMLYVPEFEDDNDSIIFRHGYLFYPHYRAAKRGLSDLPNPIESKKTTIETFFKGDPAYLIAEKESSFIPLEELLNNADDQTRVCAKKISEVLGNAIRRNLTRNGGSINTAPWIEFLKDALGDEKKNVKDRAGVFFENAAKCKELQRQLSLTNNVAASMEVLITHPTDFVEWRLLYRPLMDYIEKHFENEKTFKSIMERLASEISGNPCRCEKPLIHQPLTFEGASRVARQYISELYRHIRYEPVKLQNRLSSWPYIVMGMIEGVFGLKEDHSHSGIVTPLFGKGQLLGVLVAYSAPDKQFNEEDVEMLESISSDVGHIIQESRDHQLFYVLSEFWSQLAALNNKTVESKHFVALFASLITFVMNAIVRGDPVELSDIDADTLRNNESISEKQAAVFFYEILDDTKGDGCKSRLFIPNCEDCGVHAYSLELQICEPRSIFEQHYRELELLFNYCFAITGSVKMPAFTRPDMGDKSGKAEIGVE